MTKRTSLADLAPRKAGTAPIAQAVVENIASADQAPETPEPTAGPFPRRSKAPPPYKSILSKVDEATHKQLKRLAVDEAIPVGDLQIEALNLLFRSRRLPEIAVRVTPGESGRRE